MIAMLKCAIFFLQLPTVNDSQNRQTAGMLKIIVHCRSGCLYHSKI